ncbi:MAG: hypothetical protein IJE19_03230 [Clostridia bacterium]|nr:hypothetical protein [Clostridia bacterium]
MGRKELSPEHIIKIAVRAGIEAAQKQIEFERNKARKQAKDNRLHNTKLLIENFRMFKVHSEKSIYSAADCEESIFDILAMMSDKQFAKAESTVEAIKNSAIRTAVMVSHIEAMVETYNIWCERSGDENKRRYRVIYALYFADEAKTVDEIAVEESIDRSTVYRDVKKATEMLASLIFGINSLIE